MKNIYFGAVLLLVIRIVWALTPQMGATYVSFLLGTQLWLIEVIGICLIAYQLVSQRKK